MPILVNYTPFPNFRYYSSDNAGRDFGVIIVKGTFEIGEDGQLVVAEEQAPMIFTDVCHAAVNESSLWHPSDLVPVKPRTDVIVNAVARAPGGQPLPSWECGIRVEGPEGVLVEKRLRVTGPRRWEPRWKLRLTESERRDWRRFRPLFAGWALSEPEPVTEVPLRYELAYGGTIEAGTDEAGAPRFNCETRNPIGRGLIDPEWTDHTLPQPAPQIEALDDPVREPYRRHAPQSLGPIPPAWDPRLPLGGTYDQHWIDEVWPNWPADYDFAYHNSSHPDLMYPLCNSEQLMFQMFGLSSEHESVIFHLPKGRLYAVLTDNTEFDVERDFVMDTLFIDTISYIGDPKVLITWRIQFPSDIYKSATILREGT